MNKRNQKASFGCDQSTEGHAVFPLENLPREAQEAAEYLTKKYNLPLGSAAVMVLTTLVGAAGNRGMLYGDKENPQSATLLSIIEAGGTSAFDAAIEWLTEPIREVALLHQTSQECYGRSAIADKLDPGLLASRMNAVGLPEDLLTALAARVTDQGSDFFIEGTLRRAVMEDAIRHSYDNGLISIADTDTLSTILSMAPADRVELLQWINALCRQGALPADGTPAQLAALWLADEELATFLRYVLFEESSPLHALVVPASTPQVTDEEVSSSDPSNNWSSLVERLLSRRRYGFTRCKPAPGFNGALQGFQIRLRADYPDDQHLVETAAELCRRYALLFAACDADSTNLRLTLTPEEDYIHRAAAVVKWQAAQHTVWMQRPENLEAVRKDLPFKEQVFAGELVERLKITPPHLVRLLTGEEHLNSEDLRRWETLGT